MKKSKRKIIFSLLATTIMSTSAAHAAPVYNNYDYNKTYNTYNRGYTVNYNYNYNYNYNNNYGNNNSSNGQNNVIPGYPVWNWTIVPSKPSNRPGLPIEKPWPNQPSVPSTPKPEKPEVERPEVERPEIERPTPEKPSNPVPETPSTPGLSAVEAEVVRLVNIERQKQGLQPFVASSQLSNVARVKSEDMARNNYFNHNSPTYGSPFDMMKKFGISYRTAGENIARGQLTAQSVVNGWMNSSGHRENILNPSFNKIGVGQAKSSNGTNYWTQMFTD